MLKIIPKRLFQLISISLLLLLCIQMVSWILNNDGLYRTIASQIGFLEEGSPEKALLSVFLVFFALFIPWMAIVLVLRAVTADMATLKDEMAYLKGQSQPELFKSPEQKARFMGVIAIVIGIVLLGADVIIWNKTQEGYIALWLAVPASFILGIYAIVTGRFPKR
jgi:hypothetical protein